MRFKFSREKFIDYTKNFVICLLFCSSVFLLFKSVSTGSDSIFDAFGSFFGKDKSNASDIVAEAEPFISAAEPMFILVTAENGSHYSAKYGNSNRLKLLSQFSSVLGEALGSAGSEERITESHWRLAIINSGVFFDYIYPHPLPAIARWLGTEIDNNDVPHSARRLFLGSDDSNSLFLYYINEYDKGFYRCRTALSFSALSPLISELPIGNSFFAFEPGDDYKNLDPYFIFSGESTQLRAATSINPLVDDFVVSFLLSLFDMRQASDYQENDGSMAYVDGMRSLRVYISGKVTFSVASMDGIPIATKGDNLTIEDCISAAGSIVLSGIGTLSGDAKVGLTEIVGIEDPRNCTLGFGYTLDGIPIYLQGGALAASVQIKDGMIVRAEMFFRRYSFTGESLNPLPEKMAAAIAQISGGEPLLRYEDRRGELICSWINN